MIQLHSHKYFLTAAQCNAQLEIPLNALTQCIIDVATEHADLLGIGFRRLQQDNHLWVLSRLSLEMKRFPRLLEEFEILTWVEGYNRRFSERNFEIRSITTGATLGYARSIWFAIDKDSRLPASLSDTTHLQAAISQRPCPIERQGKLQPVADPERVSIYTVSFSDIDFNRHLTSSRYVSLLLDQFSLDTFDHHFVARFDITFLRETLFGQQLAIATSHPTANPDDSTTYHLNLGSSALARITLLKR